MNSDKQLLHAAQRGNAMIYILIALALLAGLTAALSRNTESDDLSYEQTELMTTKMTSYAASAKQVVDQMMMTGTTLANIDYNMPSIASFDTPPYIHKIYHPQGGGLSFFTPDVPPFDGVPDLVGNGWYFNMVNVQWTPSSATDLVLTAYMIDQKLCENINYKITGSKNIPVLTTNSLMQEFIPPTMWGGGSNTALDTTVCAACEGYPSMCVSNGNASPSFGYYNIIVAR